MAPMTQAHTPAARKSGLALQVLVFVLLAVAGLLYVKWMPYYNRAFVAASHHAIGKSILMGDAAHAPAPSLKAALDYAMAYGKAIWQAMVLGLLLGSAWSRPCCRPTWVGAACSAAGASAARWPAACCPCPA